MHVHWYARDTFTLFIANGVTGVRQIFGNSDLLRWRDQIAKGSLLGRRMFVASPIIDGQFSPEQTRAIRSVSRVSAYMKNLRSWSSRDWVVS